MSLQSKKAISPLIAAVLLVVIVVTIGAAVMALVRGYMTEGEQQVTVNKEAIKCGRDTSIGIVLIENTYRICNGTHESDSDLASLNVFLENTGTIDINDAQIRMIGTRGIFQNDSVLDEMLRRGGSTLINMTFDPEVVGSSIPNNCTTYE
jgi:flagellin-like protein